LRLSYIITFEPSIETLQYRIVVLWDKSNNGGGTFQLFTGGSPTPQQESCSLFDDYAGQTITQAPYNYGTRSRYKILYDRMHVMNHGDATVNNSIYVRKTIQLSGAIINYTDAGDAGGIDELMQRNLIVCLITSGSGDNNINLACRTFYTDA